MRNILEFEKDFPNVRVVRLERNYRSTKRILRVAAQLIAHNVKRKQKSQAEIEKMAGSVAEFAAQALAIFEEKLLGDEAIAAEIAGDTYHHETYYAGLVDPDQLPGCRRGGRQQDDE